MKEHIPFFSPIICMENSQSISKISQGFEVPSKQTWNVPKNLMEIFHLLQPFIMFVVFAEKVKNTASASFVFGDGQCNLTQW